MCCFSLYSLFVHRLTFSRYTEKKEYQPHLSCVLCVDTATACCSTNNNNNNSNTNINNRQSKCNRVKKTVFIGSLFERTDNFAEYKKSFWKMLQQIKIRSIAENSRARTKDMATHYTQNTLTSKQWLVRESKRETQFALSIF